MSNKVTERSNPGSKKVLSKKFDGPRIRVVEKFGELKNSKIRMVQKSIEKCRGRIEVKKGQRRSNLLTNDNLLSFIFCCFGDCLTNDFCESFL